MSMNEAIGAIKRFNNFLIISHINPEGDSIGIQFDMQILLKKMGKKSVIANDGPPPPQYDFLGVADDIVTDLERDIAYEAALVLDCPVIERIGRAERFLAKKKVLVNIDHHISNTNFGDVNWVEPNISSCGEMIYNLYKALNIPVDHIAATFLYAAIMTDTGSFAYENTSPATHTIVAELIEKGLKPDFIHQAIYENKSMPELRLLADVLSTIRLTADGKISYMYVSKRMLGRFKVGANVTEGFINYARSIKGAKVAVIFLEHPHKRNQIEISFRSKGEIDVDRLAALFGGGGHKNASGCIIKGSLKSVINKVLNAVEKNI